MKNAKNNMKRGLAQSLDAPCLTVTSHLAKVSLNSRDPVLLVDSDKKYIDGLLPEKLPEFNRFLILSFLKGQKQMRTAR